MKNESGKMENCKGGKRMTKTLQRRFALSKQGAIDLIKRVYRLHFQDISCMLSIGLLYLLVLDMMNGEIGGSCIIFYAIGVLVCLALIFIATWFQYNVTYLATYVESGVRCISLAEQLCKIPLSFFGKKDLADLTKASLDVENETRIQAALSRLIRIRPYLLSPIVCVPSAVRIKWLCFRIVWWQSRVCRVN